MRRNSGPFWKDQTLQFTEHFVYAGTSALVLSLAHIHSTYWFLSFFALIPFLWRLNRTSLSGSIVVGIILIYFLTLLLNLIAPNMEPNLAEIPFFRSFFASMFLCALFICFYYPLAFRAKKGLGVGVAFYVSFIIFLFIPNLNVVDFWGSDKDSSITVLMEKSIDILGTPIFYTFSTLIMIALLSASVLLSIWLFKSRDI